MAISRHKQALQEKSRRVRNKRCGSYFEALEGRVLRSVTAFFSPGSGVLSVIGDQADNSIVVSRDAAGHILVNGGAVTIKGPTSTVANTRLIDVFGLAGNDHISLDEANGALPVANLFGGAGDDTLTGGSANDLIFGEAGNDTLLGKGGNDLLFGGAGNDSLTGGDGNDVLSGGDGNDTINGGRGNDTALLGDGDDTFVWNPGDGSDFVDGQDGNDTMIFNGANVSEKFNVSANGSHLVLSRDIGAVTMDTTNLENINLNTLGGADAITVNDLSGTSLKQLNVDLGAIPGAIGGDGQGDTLTLNGTNAADNVEVLGNGTNYVVTGLAATVNVANSEGSFDNLVVNLLGGDDSFRASSLPAGIANLTVDGGAGDDTLTGSQGNDLLLGGDGSDLVIGGRGSDTALLGDGNDTFVWLPGEGSDIVEGQGGFDTLVFDGANVSENIDLSANGSRLRLFRDIGNVTMDVNGTEQVNLSALGGADTITVNDLTGTDVTNVNLDLAAATGDPDGQVDNVIVNGTNGNDNIIVADDLSGGVKIGGLTAVVHIAAPDPDLDQLTINALGGADTVDASGLGANLHNLTVNGGAGDDFIIGSQGNDLVNGGQGSDTAFLGAGDDTFVWNPGDGSDVVEGQGGLDTLQFNGANVGENIDLSANGSRLRLFRDVGNITMDVAGVEQVNVAARGGADNITVNDLTGTDVTTVNLDLEGTPGAGDGAVDNVIVNGTAADDVAVISGDSTGVNVTGLSAQVNINNAESANDNLIVNLLGGDDAGTAAALVPGTIKVTLDGGAGDDVLVGSAGDDTLLGGAGDDVLIGNGGQDVLDGGPGNNTLIP